MLYVPASLGPPARAHSHYGPGGRGRGRGRPFAFQVVLSTSVRVRVDRCCVRAALARPHPQAEREREPATLRSPTARDRCEGESKAASQRTEKVAFLVLQRRITDGPPSTTATRNSSRRAFRGGVRSSSCPLSLSLSLACRDGSAKGRPGCRNGQSRRRRLRRRPFGGGKIECCCWACWSAGVVALPTSCMVSCRYVVVFA